VNWIDINLAAGVVPAGVKAKGGKLFGGAQFVDFRRPIVSVNAREISVSPRCTFPAKRVERRALAAAIYEDAEAARRHT
jgi:hypothetical protein